MVGISELIAQLRTLQDMERAAVRLVAHGDAAIPPLRDLLFERDPSGIFSPRRHAVTALASLRAYEVLIDFLRRPKADVDPVERLGDEAVINAAARALKGAPNERTFRVLLALATRRLLPGVLEALAPYHRVEALPYFIAALAEDDARVAAEFALRELGPEARAALLEAATRPFPSSGYESGSSQRARRSALGLLLAIGIDPTDWHRLRPLIRDSDVWIATLACEIGLAAKGDYREIAHRLIALILNADPVLRLELEGCLTRSFDLVGSFVIAAVDAMGPFAAGDRSKAAESFHRIISNKSADRRG
jgi:hypothetical protein